MLKKKKKSKTNEQTKKQKHPGHMSKGHRSHLKEFPMAKAK